MSQSTCELAPVRTDPAGRDPGPSRWPYLVFDRDEVLLAGEPAVCLAADGGEWEYDGRHFRVAGPVTGVPLVADDAAAAPAGPWRHLPGCVCESCRLGDV